MWWNHYQPGWFNELVMYLPQSSFACATHHSARRSSPAAAKWPLSDRCWRSAHWTRTTRRHTARSLTLVLFLRSSRRSSMRDSLIMSTNIIYFQSSSRFTAHFIQPKQQLPVSLTTWSALSTRDMYGSDATRPFSRLWHCRPSTSSRFYKDDSVCRGRPSIGWLTTLVVDVRSSEQVAVIQKTLLSTSVFNKDQSLAQRHFLNTLKTSHISWKACIITCSLMTCRAKSTESQLMSQQSSQLWKTVLRTSAPGA